LLFRKTSSRPENSEAAWKRKREAGRPFQTERHQRRSWEVLFTGKAVARIGALGKAANRPRIEP
jgi:hypothetical protein